MHPAPSAGVLRVILGCSVLQARGQAWGSATCVTERGSGKAEVLLNANVKLH